MAKKHKKKREEWLGEDGLSRFKLTSRETSNTILGIFALVVSIFLLLGAFGSAGRAGNLAYELFSYLFGIGYYLMPIVFLLLSVSFLHERERNLAVPQLFGSALLFLSALGFVNLVSSKGGVVGVFLSKPLVSLFDVYLSAVLLVALIVVSILVIFDTNIRLDFAAMIRKLFGKKEKGEDETLPRESAAIEKAVEKMERQEARPEPAQAKRKAEENDGFAPMIGCQNVARVLGMGRRDGVVRGLDQLFLYDADIGWFDYEYDNKISPTKLRMWTLSGYKECHPKQPEGADKEKKQKSPWINMSPNKPGWVEQQAWGQTFIVQ